MVRFSDLGNRISGLAFVTCRFTLQSMTVTMSTARDTAYCVLQFTERRAGYPRYAAVLHDSSVAPLVDAGACMLIETGLTLKDAQRRSISLNMEAGEQWQ